MRKRFFFNFSAANVRWPGNDTSGAVAGLLPFNWLKIDNRGSNPVVVGLNSNVQNDAMDYYMQVAGGKVRIVNVAGPKDDPQGGDGWPHSLSVMSITGSTSVMIEIADHEISDIDQAIP